MGRTVRGVSGLQVVTLLVGATMSSFLLCEYVSQLRGKRRRLTRVQAWQLLGNDLHDTPACTLADCDMCAVLAW